MKDMVLKNNSLNGSSLYGSFTVFEVITSKRVVEVKHVTLTYSNSLKIKFKKV